MKNDLSISFVSDSNFRLNFYQADGHTTSQITTNINLSKKITFPRKTIAKLKNDCWVSEICHVMTLNKTLLGNGLRKSSCENVKLSDSLKDTHVIIFVFNAFKYYVLWVHVQKRLEDWKEKIGDVKLQWRSIEDIFWAIYCPPFEMELMKNCTVMIGDKKSQRWSTNVR